MSSVETVNAPSFDPMARIEAFYEHRGEACSRETYMVLDTGNYITYAFRPEPRAIEWLVERIGGSDWKSRLGVLALETVVAVPNLLPFVPLLRWETVSVPAEESFDVAVIGDRITMLELER
ncbi:MAG: hypothetical protein M8354_12010, partial [Halalkalicoccus sp.]|nr:hypothetical protein [Halalkalicoccus sp.]